MEPAAQSGSGCFRLSKLDEIATNRTAAAATASDQQNSKMAIGGPHRPAPVAACLPLEDISPAGLAELLRIEEADRPGSRWDATKAEDGDDRPRPSALAVQWEQAVSLMVKA